MNRIVKLASIYTALLGMFMGTEAILINTILADALPPLYGVAKGAYVKQIGTKPHITVVDTDDHRRNKIAARRAAIGEHGVSFKAWRIL